MQFFILPFDLTTSLKAGAEDVICKTQVGRLRLEVFFSNPLDDDISLAHFSETTGIVAFVKPKGGSLTVEVSYDTGAM